MDTDDVLVVQARGQFGLTIETLAKFQILGQIAGQDFQGIAAGQPRMLGQIDVTHPAGAQPSNDGVSGEHLSFRQTFAVATALRHVSMLLRPRPAATG